MEIHLADLHYFLNRFALFEPQLRRLLDHQKPEDLSVEEIDQLPRLNLRLPQTFVKNPEKQWKWIFEPYFTTGQLVKKSSRQHQEYWQARLEIGRALPENLYVFVGQPRQPEVTQASLEDALKTSGMQGCDLDLVAKYRDSFDYVLEVLKILAKIRDHEFPKLSELERSRLSNPFYNRNESFNAVIELMNQTPKLERIRQILNPENIEGPVTPILENLSKLCLHGLTAPLLKEILLIMVGYSPMSRIVFGKLSEKTLRSITDRAREDNYRDIVDLLRVCRLMSMAEIAATLGESFTGEQAKELYRLYDDAILWPRTQGSTGSVSRISASVPWVEYKTKPSVRCSSSSTCSSSWIPGRSSYTGVHSKRRSFATTGRTGSGTWRKLWSWRG